MRNRKKKYINWLTLGLGIGVIAERTNMTDELLNLSQELAEMMKK